MIISKFQKFTLLIAGLTALGIGGFIMTAPRLFYSYYGIELGHNPDLLSELRGLAASLATLGSIMLAGLFRPALAHLASAVALTVFLAFPLGRLISLALDGLPSADILGALGIELAIGALCVAAFWRRSTWTVEAPEDYGTPY